MRAAVLLLGLAACGDKADDSAAPPPDVTGRYQVQITTISGCDNDVSLVQPWAQGPLEVSGAGGALTFDFGDGASFSGSLSADGSYVFSGDWAWAGTEQLVRQDGRFTQEDGTWTGEGLFQNRVSVDEFESTDCTLEATMVATWIAPLN
jgi:hypothetical protein